MCNPADQAGADYASDSKRINVLVSEMDNLVICADTSASIPEGTSEVIANHSNGALVEVNEAAVPMSSALLVKANGIGGDHSYNTSEHFANEVPIPGKGDQGIVDELVDQTRETSKTCIAMITSLSEGDRTEKDDTHIPSIHVKNSSNMSGYVCNPNFLESEDDAHPMSAEYRKVETKPMETGTLLENMSSETKSQIEVVKFEEEALQETSKELVGDSVTLGGLPDGPNRETSIKAVEAWSCTSASGESQSAANPADELSLDPCKGAENPETRPDMVHTDSMVEIDDLLALEGLGVGSEGHSTGPCSERDNVMVVNNSDVKLDAKEQVLIDFNESLAWIEMRPSVAECTAASAEESTSGAIQITTNAEEMENETAVGSVETQNTPQQPEQMTQDVVIPQHAERSISTTPVSSEVDAADHGSRSFKEANGETPSEIEQEGAIASSDAATLKRSSQPELAEFFSNARGSKLEKEIEEQECAPVLMKVPLKKKLFMESPRSLRMLLFSEETAQSTKKDEKHKKDGKNMEFSSKVVPATDSHSNENRAEHNYPAKWYENPDIGEASNVFSGPMAFSGALTHQGVISYSGQIPYSGSISHRSDSSTSTRSFAFPILASDWNSSPVKMSPPDPRFYRPPRRKLHFCFCCRRPSTLFD